MCYHSSHINSNASDIAYQLFTQSEYFLLSKFPLLKTDTIIRTIFILKHLSIEKQYNYKIRLFETATSNSCNDKMYGISIIIIHEAKRMWWKFPILLLDIYAVIDLFHYTSATLHEVSIIGMMSFIQNPLDTHHIKT